MSSGWKAVAVAGVLVIVGGAGAAWAAEITGRFKALSEEAGIISVVTPQKGVMLFRYGAKTVFRNVGKPSQLVADDGVSISYTGSGEDNLATTVVRTVALVPEGVATVTTAQLAALLQGQERQPAPMVIDTRLRTIYDSRHIPGAVSIPLAELEKRGGVLFPQDRSTPLVFYCDGPASDLSVRAAGLARQFGFSDVRVYLAGEPGWEKDGQPLAVTREYLRKAGPVLLDLRSPAAVQEGHIPGAVGVPAATLATRQKLFPTERRVPMVFYSDRDEDARRAVQQLRDWGYRSVAIYPGGLAAWQARGGEVETGPARTSITYGGRIEIGDVKPAEYKLALESTVSVIFVDVRTGGEFARGHLARSINIPLEELPRRLGELPKNKILIINCSNGVRAEMAYDFLKQREYRVVYLKAPISFAGDGSFTIAE
jgi:rhodanese-related sulfurtransferase